MMPALEAAANFFYDPYVYWGLPLVLAVLLEVLREVVMRLRPPGNGPEIPGGRGG